MATAISYSQLDVIGASIVTPQNLPTVIGTPAEKNPYLLVTMQQTNSLGGTMKITSFDAAEIAAWKPGLNAKNGGILPDDQPETYLRPKFFGRFESYDYPKGFLTLMMSDGIRGKRGDIVYKGGSPLIKFRMDVVGYYFFGLDELGNKRLGPLKGFSVEEQRDKNLSSWAVETYHITKLGKYPTIDAATKEIIKVKDPAFADKVKELTAEIEAALENRKLDDNGTLSHWVADGKSYAEFDMLKLKEYDQAFPATPFDRTKLTTPEHLAKQDDWTGLVNTAGELIYGTHTPQGFILPAEYKQANNAA
jgi:hypothetical protein